MTIIIMINCCSHFHSGSAGIPARLAHCPEKLEAVTRMQTNIVSITLVPNARSICALGTTPAPFGPVLLSQLMEFNITPKTISNETADECNDANTARSHSSMPIESSTTQPVAKPGKAETPTVRV